MGDEVSGVHDDTVGSARGVEVQYSLDGDVHGRGVEGLEHDLSHLLPVGYILYKGTVSFENMCYTLCYPL